MKRRHGFTLVELLVSMALIIFMMAILSQAFIAALGVFRNLKGQGDLAEKLRSTTQILQSDLAANHFDGSKRLSDSNFWSNGPPSQGFFRIWQGSPSVNPPTTTTEGNDPSNIGSYFTTNNSLAFTVKKSGNDMGDFMSASGAGSGLGTNVQLGTIQTFGPPESRYQLTSGGAYNYQWAEVAWFLQPQINPATGQPDMTAPDPNAGTATGVPLFTLYRRQCLLVPDNNLVTLAALAATPPSSGLLNTQAPYFLEVSNSQDPTNPTSGYLHFNNPKDITVPWRRFGMASKNATTGYAAGLPYAAYLSYPWTTWPVVLPSPPLPPSPWSWAPPYQLLRGSWVPPNPLLSPLTPPTYLPYVPAPGQQLYPYPSYPTLIQEGSTTLQGADIQLNDVISFDVRVFILGLFTSATDPFVMMTTAANTYSSDASNPLNPSKSNNPAFYPAVNNPSAPAVFDTWTNTNDNDLVTDYSAWQTPGSLTSIPMYKTIKVGDTSVSGPIIKAIQITIRIWDFKTSQTRQVTIVQAM